MFTVDGDVALLDDVDVVVAGVEAQDDLCRVAGLQAGHVGRSGEADEACHALRQIDADAPGLGHAGVGHIDRIVADNALGHRRVDAGGGDHELGCVQPCVVIGVDDERCPFVRREGDGDALPVAAGGGCVAADAVVDDRDGVALEQGNGSDLHIVVRHVAADGCLNVMQRQGAEVLQADGALVGLILEELVLDVVVVDALQSEDIEGASLGGLPFAGVAGAVDEVSAEAHGTLIDDAEVSGLVGHAVQGGALAVEDNVGLHVDSADGGTAGGRDRAREGDDVLILVGALVGVDGETVERGDCEGLLLR